MLSSKKYYKIIRCVLFKDFKSGNEWEIKHSCFIPYHSKFSLQYRKGEWSYGEDLFVYDLSIERLKELTESTCESFRVIDSYEEKWDMLKHIQIELWSCVIGNTIHIDYTSIKPVHKFLKNPEEGKNYLDKSKDQTLIKSDQIVTDKIKLIKNIFICKKDKIYF